MKKYAIALVLCIIGALALTACDGGGSSANDGPVTITYAMWGDSNEVATVQGAIDQFESEQDRIRVEIIHIDRAEYEAAMNTRAVAGNLPDSGIVAEGMVIPWAEAGILADVSGMFEGFPEAPLPKLGFNWDGDTVAYSVANELILLFYNRDMFAAAGLNVPPADVTNAWSWDQFVDTAMTLTIDGAGNNAHSPNFNPANIVQYGASFDGAIWMLETWALANGGGFFNPSNPNDVIINQAAAVEAIQRVADLHLVHNAAPQFGTNTATTIATQLATNTAMQFNGQWSIGVWLGPAANDSSHADYIPGFNYGVGVLPSMQRNVTISTGGANVVFNTSPHVEEALEWLAWYSQVENSWPLIESGIWMPVFPIWYNDEDYMRRWADNINFPPFEEYRSAVISYALTNAEPTAWYWVNNTDQFNDVLATALAPVWSGDQTAQQAIDGAMDALRAAVLGN